MSSLLVLERPNRSSTNAVGIWEDSESSDVHSAEFPRRSPLYSAGSNPHTPSAGPCVLAEEPSDPAGKDGGAIATEWESVLGGPLAGGGSKTRLRCEAAEFRPFPLRYRRRKRRPRPRHSTPIVVREMIKSRASPIASSGEKIETFPAIEESFMENRRKRSPAVSPQATRMPKMVRDLSRTPQSPSPPSPLGPLPVEVRPRAAPASPPSLSLAALEEKPATPVTPKPLVTGIPTRVLWRKKSAQAPRPRMSKLKSAGLFRSVTTQSHNSPPGRKNRAQQTQHYKRVLHKKNNMVGKSYVGHLSLTPKGNGWVVTKAGLPNIRISSRVVNELELEEGNTLVARVDGCSDGKRGSSRVNCYSSTVRLARQAEATNQTSQGSVRSDETVGTQDQKGMMRGQYWARWWAAQDECGVMAIKENVI